MRDLVLPEMGAAEPWWLNLELFGFEDDDDDDLEDEDEDDDTDEDEEDSEDGDESDDEDEEDEEDEDEESEKDKKSKSKKKNTAGLVSALRKERMGRKRAERELRQLKARNKDRKTSNGQKPASSKKKDADKADDQEVVEEDQGPSEREKKLAAGLLRTAVDRHIMAVATQLNFADPEDAIDLVSRKDIITDQDEEDPTEIEIDEESVEDAVKALAKKKKHLIKPRNAGTGGRTASKMGGSRKKGEPNDDALRRKYNLGARRS